MTTLAFLAVMLAAALHATWNAIVKGGTDKHLSMTALTIGQGLPAVPLLALWAPFPDASSWWLIAVSAALHIGYQLFLLNAYRLGDFTQVYPIARGSAPLIVTAFSVAVLGVALTGHQLLAIGLIASGIIALGLVRRADGLRNPRAAVLALGTGCFIAGYSVVDGIGARTAGTGPGFYACVALLNAIAFSAFMEVRHPGVVRRSYTAARTTLLVGGCASFAAYCLVVWAFTLAPIALVTALREVSIVFALAIGIVVFQEKLNLIKMVTTMVTVAGVVLIRWAG
jgi:drug/metabolite transporter (DMT)-like permease